MDTPPNHRFPALTGIRFPLAVWVISYHISGPGQMWEFLTGTPSSEAFMSKAYVALGTFFALSGFLLSLAYLDGRWDVAKLSRYLVARAARIAPLYYFSLLVMAPIIWSQLRDPAFEYNRTGVLTGYLLLLQGWVRYPVDWNTPAWSLSCEVFYYACLPLAALFLPARWGRSALMLMVMGFGLPVVVYFLQPPAALKPFTYLGDFVVGMACAALYQSIRQQNHGLSGRGYWLYVPAGLLASALVIWGNVLPWLAFDELMRLANGALVLGLVFGGGAIDRILSSRVVMAGGAASFAAYILHVPVLWWFRRTLPGIAEPGFLPGVFYLLAVWWIALAAYRWIEEPANTFLRWALLSKGHTSSIPIEPCTALDIPRQRRLPRYQTAATAMQESSS